MEKHHKHDYIQNAAYYIWIERGRPDGQDREIWAEAERRYDLAHVEPVRTKRGGEETALSPIVSGRSITILAAPIRKPAEKTVRAAKTEDKTYDKKIGHLRKIGGKPVKDLKKDEKPVNKSTNGLEARFKKLGHKNAMKISAAATKTRSAAAVSKASPSVKKSITVKKSRTIKTMGTGPRKPCK